jgi:Cu(I)-responsive transcriptional regulator
MGRSSSAERVAVQAVFQVKHTVRADQVLKVSIVVRSDCPSHRDHLCEETPMRRPPELGEARSDGMLNIGRVAEAAGVSAKMVRHYESIGLLPAASRTLAGYRIYQERDIHLLRFIRRARELGFAMKEIGDLLGLWNNRRRASADVKKLAARHMEHLDEKIRELQAMRDTLAQLANHCHGDARPDCPILEELATSAKPRSAPRERQASLKRHH